MINRQIKYRLLSTIFSIVLCSPFLYSQNATNVHANQEGDSIIITYDLNKRSSVRIFVATGKSTQYVELKAVTGNIGDDILPGMERQVTWQPLKEHKEFVAQNVRFKVETKPIQYYFSVSATQKVAFSKGNLQYRASTNTWRFAPHQWDCIGNANANISRTYDGWIDLFGWGTGNNPTDTIISSNLIFVDWGKNKIGTYSPNTWRTLSADEWKYIFNRSHNLFSMGCVNGVKGCILLPDNWIEIKDIHFLPRTYLNVRNAGGINMDANYILSRNTYTTTAWKRMEDVGAVFLPISDARRSLRICEWMKGDVQYWTSTMKFAGTPYYEGSDQKRPVDVFIYLCFRMWGQIETSDSADKILRMPVRLVRDL